jgi:hypothetical protein
MKWMIGVSEHPHYCLFHVLCVFFNFVSIHYTGSSWKICKESGLKWGGRGFGGRAAGRQTVQARDIVIEGCTMAYLGTNLLDRTTVRLLQRRRYGLIGRNGVGKRFVF